MSRKAEILTALGTVGCALGIGFVMQSTTVNDLRYGSGDVVMSSSLQLVGMPARPFHVVDFAFDKENVQSLDVHEIELTSAKVDVFQISDVIPAAPISASVSSDDIENLIGLPDVEQELSVPECDLSASAVADAAAMVRLTLNAPCYSGDRISVHHEGITFSERVSEDGAFEALVPALVPEASFKISFMDGKTVSTNVRVDSVALYDRVVLGWEGRAGVQIHAREYDADYGTEGHVWAGAPRSVPAITDGRGGFLTALGDSALAMSKMVEVYTFPASISGGDQVVSLSIETEVTEENCGKRIYAKSVQYSDGIEVFSQDLNLPVPGCSAVGSFLVLNNLVQNLKVAQK